jgi:predicted P-loop ATPase
MTSHEAVDRLDTFFELLGELGTFDSNLSARAVLLVMVAVVALVAVVAVVMAR